MDKTQIPSRRLDLHSGIPKVVHSLGVCAHSTDLAGVGGELHQFNEADCLASNVNFYRFLRWNN